MERDTGSTRIKLHCYGFLRCFHFFQPHGCSIISRAFLIQCCDHNDRIQGNLSQRFPAATSSSVLSSSSTQVTKTNFAPPESLRISKNTLENPLDGTTALNGGSSATNPLIEMPAHTTAVVVVPVYPSFVPTVTAGILLRNAGRYTNPNVHGLDILSRETKPIKKADMGGNTENFRCDGRSIPDTELNLNIFDPVLPSLKPTSTSHASPATKASTYAPSQVIQPPNSIPKPSTANKPKSTPPAMTPTLATAPHWPYPYPGEGKATSFKPKTKKASETGKAKAKAKSTGWCPYPGQNCQASSFTLICLI
jgi:hypothetical protein